MKCDNVEEFYFSKVRISIKANGNKGEWQKEYRRMAKGKSIKANGKSIKRRRSRRLR